MKLKFVKTKELKTYETTDVKAHNGQIVEVAPHRGVRLLKIWPKNFFPPEIDLVKLGKPIHEPLKLSQITVVTIHYWPSDVLERCLLPGLPKEVEFIKIDNTDNKLFTSAAKALNYAIKKAKNDVIILAHEDTKFGKDWFTDFIKQECRLKNWGALGIVGTNFDKHMHWGSNHNAPYKMRTLDECCIIINRKNNIWFDEKTFKHFHCYGTDFCFQCLAKGLGVYVIPGVATHAHRGYDHDQAWFKRIRTEQNIFWKKWKKKLKVDILIPTFNRPRLLRRAIKSVLEQQSPRWELYIYNDGSHYDLKKIKRKFGRKKIHWLGKKKVSNKERSEVGHISKVRNYLAQASHNELVLWLDDDDWLWPEAVEGIVEYFGEHPEVKIAYGKKSGVFENTDPEAPREKRIMWAGIPLKDPYCRVGCAQVVMRREVLDYAKWPTKNLPKGTLEDAVFWQTLGKKYTFYPVDVWMANVYYRSSKCHHVLTEQGRPLNPVRE